MRIAASFAAVLLSAVTAFAQAAPTPAGPGMDSGQTQKIEPKPVEKVPTRSFGVAQTFVMPSGNIGCIYIPAGGTEVYQPADGGPELSCDRIEPNYIRATLGASGRAFVINNVGDQGCCGGDLTVDYGQTWRGGPFTCYSERTGLTCERDDGHSFLLSRARVRAD